MWYFRYSQCVYEDSSRLGCYIVFNGKYIPTFPLSSSAGSSSPTADCLTLEDKETTILETPVAICHSIWRNIPADFNLREQVTLQKIGRFNQSAAGRKKTEVSTVTKCTVSWGFPFWNHITADSDFLSSLLFCWSSHTTILYALFISPVRVPCLALIFQYRKRQREKSTYQSLSFTTFFYPWLPLDSGAAITHSVWRLDHGPVLEEKSSIPGRGTQSVNCTPWLLPQVPSWPTLLHQNNAALRFPNIFIPCIIFRVPLLPILQFTCLCVSNLQKPRISGSDTVLNRWSCPLKLVVVSDHAARSFWESVKCQFKYETDLHSGRYDVGWTPTSIGELPVTPRKKSGDIYPLSVRVFKYFHDMYISKFAQPQFSLHAQPGTTPTEQREQEFHRVFRGK